MKATKLVLCLIACLIGLGAGTLHGAPCVEASLDTYKSLGSSGCSIGIFTFKNFDWILIEFDPSSVEPNEITVIPRLEGRSPVLRFESERFLFPNEFGFFLYQLFYLVESPVPILNGLNAVMEADEPAPPTPGPTFSVEALTLICVGADANPLDSPEDCPSAANTRVFYETGASVDRDLVDTAFFGPVDIIGVTNRLGQSGLTPFDGLENRILLTPEPASWILAAAGLAALRAASSRLKRS